MKLLPPGLAHFFGLRFRGTQGSMGRQGKAKMTEHPQRKTKMTENERREWRAGREAFHAHARAIVFAPEAASNDRTQLAIYLVTQTDCETEEALAILKSTAAHAPRKRLSLDERMATVPRHRIGSDGPVLTKEQSVAAAWDKATKGLGAKPDAGVGDRTGRGGAPSSDEEEKQ